MSDSSPSQRDTPPRVPPPSAACAKEPQPRWQVTALALALLAATGASCGLYAALLAVPRAARTAFVASNDLDTATRTHLTLALLGGATLALGFCIAYLARRRAAAIPTLIRVARGLSPLLLSCVLPVLFIAQPWHDSPVPFLVLLVGVGLSLERALRLALPEVPLKLRLALVGLLPRSERARRLLPLGVVLLGSLGYAIYFSYYTVLNHQRLATTGFDLGINVNWAYNALQGDLWRSTVLFGEHRGHFLSTHAIFAQLLYLPLFAIHPGAEFFLIMQAVMVGLAGTTLYLFASTQLPRWPSVVVAYAFLLFAPVHGPNFYDYHELLPPLVFHFLLYYAIASHKNALAIASVLLVWAYREDLPVGTCGLGLFMVAVGFRARFGALLAAASLVWFVTLKFAIMPSFGRWWFADIYRELQPAGTRGYGPIVQTMLVNQTYLLKTLLTEQKLVYALHFMAPLLLLPLRRPAFLLLIIPGFCFNLLTTGYEPTVSIAFHYTCHVVPYVFAASVLALKLLGAVEGGETRRTAALGALALVTLSHSYVFGAVLQHQTFVGGFGKIEFGLTPEQRQRYATVARLSKSIPVEASVAASENLVPHVAARRNAFTLKDGVPVKADYLFLHGDNVRHDVSRKAVAKMVKRDSFALVASADDIYLFKRGEQTPATLAALSSLRIGKAKK